MKELYVSYGFGVNERLFQILDLSGFSTKFIKWIIPNLSDTIQL